VNPDGVAQKNLLRGAFVAAMLMFALAALVGCTSVPSPGDRATLTEEPSVASDASTAADAAEADEAERTALALIKSAKAYQASMNARVITQTDERLQPDRGPGIFAVVRIDRNGAPVDLHFLRRTGELRQIAFGTRDGKLLYGYDKFKLATGDQVLALVEELGKRLPTQP